MSIIVFCDAFFIIASFAGINLIKKSLLSTLSFVLVFIIYYCCRKTFLNNFNNAERLNVTVPTRQPQISQGTAVNLHKGYGDGGEHADKIKFSAAHNTLRVSLKIPKPNHSDVCKPWATIAIEEV